MINLHSQEVTVGRKQLLDALRVNLKVHQAEYAEAYADYQEKVIFELEAALKRAKSGDFKKAVVSINAPVSHEKEFTDVIEMLEMSVHEEILLDRQVFRAYFKNEWPWADAFKLAGATYKSR